MVGAKPGQVNERRGVGSTSIGNSFRRKNDIESIASSNNIEFSCHQLGFYLANWGVNRRPAFRCGGGLTLAS